MDLWQRINSTMPAKGSTALFYLAQAGFCIRTDAGKTIVIDPYLSDACERLFGFKRMIPPPMAAEELKPDLYLCTHHHADHLDPDTVPVVLNNPETFFVVAPDCVSLFEEQKLPKSRYVTLAGGQAWESDGIRIRAIYADHGELAPDAVGYLIELDDIKIYHAGDTAYRPKEILASLNSAVDIMIVPINGQYGNMTASEACLLAQKVCPKILIPCHFWMFVEHVAGEGKGDPATFLKEAGQLPKTVTATVMAPESFFIYSAELPLCMQKAY